ncbi:hypothetical protein HWV62_26354 [Athelia sp. TMB]|nr:hypothetical protein HWV62_26354 [Athelia sp. TMB]
MRTYPTFIQALSVSQSSFSSDDNCYSPYVKSRPWYEEGFTPDIYEDDEFLEVDIVEVYSMESTQSKTRVTWSALFAVRLGLLYASIRLTTLALLQKIRHFVQGVIPSSSRHSKASNASLN